MTPRLFTYAALGLFLLTALLPVLYLGAAPFWPGAAGSLFQGLFESRQLALAKNSAGLAGGAALFCLLSGALYAFLIARTDLKGEKWFARLCLLPILIPPYIHAIVWTRIDPRVPFFDLHSVGGAVWVLTLSYFPFVVLTALAGLKSIDRRQEEAALMSAGPWKALGRITLPLMAPHLFAGAVLVFVLSIIEAGVPDILRVKVYPLEIFIQFSAFYDTGKATLLAFPLVFLTLLLVLLQRWVMRARAYVQMGGGRAPAIQFRLGIWQAAGVGFCFLMLLCAVGVPLGVLLKTAGGPEVYARVLSTSAGQIGYGLVTALAGAFLAAALGYGIAYLSERLKGWKSHLVALAAVIPLAMPATAMGIGLIGLWNRPFLGAVYGSSLMLVLAYAARFVPFAALISAAGIGQVPARLEEAALLAGASWQRTQARVLFPLCRRHLLAGFFIVFILAFGELGTTLLVTPPGRETVPVKIYNLLHYGAEELLAALCVLLVTLIFTAAGCFLWLYRKMSAVKEIA